MGIVLLARDVALDRLVAIKMLRSALSADPPVRRNASVSVAIPSLSRRPLQPDRNTVADRL